MCFLIVRNGSGDTVAAPLIPKANSPYHLFKLLKWANLVTLLGAHSLQGLGNSTCISQNLIITLKVKFSNSGSAKPEGLLVNSIS